MAKDNVMSTVNKSWEFARFEEFRISNAYYANNVKQRFLNYQKECDLAFRQ